MVTTLSGLRLSADYLTGYFDELEKTTSAGTVWSLHTATRPSLDESFTKAVLLGDSAINGFDTQNDPTVRGDGLALIFGGVERREQPSMHLYLANRASTEMLFAYVGPLPNVNDSAGEDARPFLREDGRVLYFSSSRNSANHFDIYRATWDGSAFGAPVAVSELNTVSDELYPIVTPDDLTIFFASGRSNGVQGIWMSSRRSANDPFSAPRSVPELNGPGVQPTFVTRDGCVLYFSVMDAIGTRSQYFADKVTP
jgi:Tol biopolymer transport system component